MYLDEANRGQRMRVLEIPDAAVRAQAIRFGIAPGTEVICAEKVIGGPVVIARGKQEIAVGRRLAQQIRVEWIDE